ncbi:MAG: YidH family protein, partial [Syntrophales bacterium]
APFCVLKLKRSMISHMSEIIEDKKSAKVRNRRVHMANERTFLAWIRTSIGIMAFGFVVEKFALFIKQMSLILGNANIENVSPPSHGYSAIVGIFLVGLGTLMGLLAFVRYKKVERQINEDTYQPSSILYILITISVLAVGIFLVVYLIHST